MRCDTPPVMTVPDAALDSLNGLAFGDAFGDRWFGILRRRHRRPQDAAAYGNPGDDSARHCVRVSERSPSLTLKLSRASSCVGIFRQA